MEAHFKPWDSKGQGSMVTVCMWSDVDPLLLKWSGKSDKPIMVVDYQSVPSPPCKLHSLEVWGSIKFVVGERGTLSPDPQALFFILRLPVALVTNWWLVQGHYLGVPVTDTRSNWQELVQLFDYIIELSWWIREVYLILSMALTWIKQYIFLFILSTLPIRWGEFCHKDPQYFQLPNVVFSAIGGKWQSLYSLHGIPWL